ncbi:arylesterase [Mesorhizobium marinum]|uniref:Arylesterase n=1 Tax=Mesorhizobium marinum TaxID=3228790 RepID=A0ABV3QYS1_9HYPH
MAFKSALRPALLACFALVALAASARAEPYRIVGFGDSLMAGYGLDAGQSFPEKLEKALRAKGHDVVIEQAGVSGDTTSGGLARLEWSVPGGTRLVILELGANDMLRGIGPEITESNLDAMLARLEERDIAVLLAGMRAAPNLGPDYQAAFDPIYPRLAEKHGVALYPFFLEGVAADRAYLLEDGMHPNAAGIDRIVEGMLPEVEKFVVAAQPAAGQIP